MTRREDREKRWRLLVAAVALSALAACGGGGGYGGGGGATTYTLGGMAAGVNGPGLVLRNGDERLSVAATGAFTFATRLAAGASYAVSVSGHPANQTCSATNASGTMGTANVTNIAVACVAAEPPPPPPPNTYTIGGEVTGLSGSGLVLTNTFGSGSADLGVSGNGAFTFGARVADGMPYAVSVSTQPSGQTCVVTNARGTVAGGHVTNIRVNCGTSSGLHAIGGQVAGLTASGLVLRNNGEDPINIAPGAVSFTFPARVSGGYNVTVDVQPGTDPSNSQDCTITRGQGSATADVSNVEVSCADMGSLKLLGSNPPDGATDVPTDVQPMLNFSSPVASVAPGGVRLTERATGTEVALTWTISGSRVRLEPATKLKPFTAYDQSAGVGLLRGTRGEVLGLDSGAARSFTTGDLQWRDTHALTPVAVPANLASSDKGHSMALDNAGDAIAAWISPSKLNAVQLSYYKASRGTWEAGPSMSGAVGGPAKSPQLVMDNLGNALLVWMQNLPVGNSTHDVLWAARFRKGDSTWEAPQVISHQDSSTVKGFAVAARGDGKVVMAWVRLDPGDAAIYLRTSTTAFGASWSSDHPDVARMDVAQAGISDAQAELAVAIAPEPPLDDRAEIAVLWAKQAAANGNTYVWGRVLRGNGTRAAPLALSDGSAQMEHLPQVVVDDAFVVRAVWRRFHPPNFAVLGKTMFSHGNGGPNVELGPVQQVRSSPSAPLISRNGRWVGWQQADNVSGTLINNLWVARFDGSERQGLGADGSFAAGVWPGWLGSDRDGNMLALWSNGMGLVASRYVQSAGRWTLQAGRSGTRVGPYGAPPSGFAINERGSVLASWVDAAFAEPTGVLYTRMFD